jgi:AAT family amino acid transporter
MAHIHKLSLRHAILVNINIMWGIGVIINTVELASRTGLAGALSYVIIGLLLFPLVNSLALLVHLYPSGGFYTYATRTIHPLVGFFSAWSYFIGKLASATLTLHAAVRLLQTLFPHFALYNPFLIDGVIITLFSFLNLLNVRTGSNIQMFFMSLKIIPITFVVATAAFASQWLGASSDQVILNGIPSTLPLVLFAILGFEAICSLSGRIENPEKNAPRAIFYSYFIVIAALALYQLSFYLQLGPLLIQAGSYLKIFPVLTEQLLPFSPSYSLFIECILHSVIAVSALGGVYSILYSNNWNLYILAQHKHIPYAHIFTKLNCHGIPTACIITETVLCLFYLALTQGTVLYLQQMGVLGSVIAYFCSVIGLCLLQFKQITSGYKIIPLAALASCTLLLITCLRMMAYSTLIPLAAFTGLIVFGLFLYSVTSFSNSTVNS